MTRGLATAASIATTRSATLRQAVDIPKQKSVLGAFGLSLLYPRLH